VHHPRGDIHPDMRLHPEVPLVALPGLVKWTPDLGPLVKV
jgi:hypothetical protein